MVENEATNPKLELFLFGTPRVELEGLPVHVARRKALALLTYLAATEAPHSRDALATLFWPETSQRKARGNLRRALSDLNREIGNEWLLLDGDAVALVDDAGFFSDVARFRTHIAACAQHDHTAEEQCANCLAHLTAAVELYQADLLAGFTLRDAPEFDDWQFFESEGLRRALASALERLVIGYRTLGNPEAAVPFAHRWQALDPLHEPAQQALMRVYVEAGQRAAALRQYELFVTRMDEEFGQPPDAETTALYTAIKAGRPRTSAAQTGPVHAPAAAPASPLATEPRHHLPAQLSPFVGREEELAEISGFLRQRAHRLVTLVGPGGIGKTRLSLAAAEAVKADFADGVHFVPLAPLQTADNIIAEVIDSLEVRFYGPDEPKTQLLDYLAPKELLLIMDNFEHLLAGAGAVSEILRAAPGVKVLASSRERLNLSGETAYVVGGMNYPGLMAGRAAIHDHTGYSAVKLLLQQARLVRPGLVVSDDLLDDAVRICRLVQGMPLAIVLAAGWLEMLSLAEIADEIAGSLDFLETEMRDVPDRQRSMRAVFDRSWARLAAGEQAVFTQLTVFRGDFSRDGAAIVAGAKLHTLRGLVNKSFVTFNQRDRFEVHELLRQYGAEMLAASGEEAATRQRHSAHYLDFVRRCEADLRGPSQVDTLRAIRADFENVRTAWDWALTHGHAPAIGDAAESMHLYFDMYGLYRAGIEFFARTFGMMALGEREAPQRAWAKVLARLRFMQSMTSDIAPTWHADLRTCQQLAAQAEDAREVAFCSAIIGAYFFTVEHNLAASLAQLELALQQFQAVDDRFYQARVLGWLAFCHRLALDPVENERHFRKKLALTRAIGDVSGITVALYNLAEVALIAGRYAEVNGNCAEVISLGRGLSQPFSQCMLSLDNLLDGELDAAQQGLQRAAELGQTSHSVDLLMFMHAVSSLGYALREECEQSVEHARACLDMPASDPLYIAIANWGLAMGSCNLGDFPSARQYLTAAFDPARNLNSLAIQTWLLPVAAVISAVEGEDEQAGDLLALASCHALSPTGWHGHWQLLSELERTRGNGLVQDVDLRGQSLDLDAVVLDWLDADSAPPTTFG